MTDLELFFDVLDLTGLLYAAASGIAFGATALLYVSLRFPPKVPQSTKLIVAIAIIASAAAGSLFFAGQIVQAYASADPFWPRALGRAALWEVFSVGIGVGLGFARSFARSRVNSG